MKTKIIKVASLSLLFGASLVGTSCKNDDIFPETSQSEANNHSSARTIDNLAVVQFNVDKFAENIETYMNGKVAGYGYTIMHEGQIYYRGKGGGGWARRAVDGTPVEHSAQQRQDIASSTKFATALATVALLEKYKLSLQEPVYLYLPTNWKPSENFKKLTFERLLSHRTGLINYNGDWNNMKKSVEGEMKLDEFLKNTRTYNNINYSLLGVILPYLIAKKEFPADYAALKKLEDKPTEIYPATGIRFTGLMRKYVFQPAGIQNWSVVDFGVWNNNGPMAAEQGSRGYATANGNETGLVNGDYRRNGAPGGLYISPTEFAQIQRRAAEGKIVSATNYQVMKDKLLGFDGTFNGSRGKYYWKNGGANHRATMIFDFGKTQVAVFANSSTSEISSKASILINAYESAWIAK
ncbi:hypothetical protein GCM10027275_07390 [Rhabdobacter roseus]|uniref:CubicO group peptidase (Beta-lactamase class C family) n=1 Tax=Rhabdobacter roseus TaxID=1655419 RepID=A0A840TEU0_9BACT|nr:serine hydrolase domain-containing protein [Rhabdobacter roseus]MBB5282636.1 CubicO group peptidase (beta-lactamase class C family) [Rhabdobacter roseus]